MTQAVAGPRRDRPEGGSHLYYHFRDSDGPA